MHVVYISAYTTSGYEFDSRIL